MAHIVNMHEAKTQLSRLVKESLEGEDVIIARGNKPLARIVPIAEKPMQRTLGARKELVVEMTDDFDAPLADFEGYMSK